MRDPLYANHRGAPLAFTRTPLPGSPTLPEVCEAVTAGSGVNQRDLRDAVRKIVAAFRDSELAARLLEVHRS